MVNLLFFAVMSSVTLLYSYPGLGDAACFYISCVFALNGMMAAVIFVIGAHLR